MDFPLFTIWIQVIQRAIAPYEQPPTFHRQTKSSIIDCLRHNSLFSCRIFLQLQPIQPQTNFAKDITEMMREIQTIQTANHDSSKLFVFKQLDDSTYVFLPNDTVCGSLLERTIWRKFKTNQIFSITVYGHGNKVSTDHLKSVFIEIQQQAATTNSDATPPLGWPQDTSKNTPSTLILLQQSTRPRRTIRLPGRCTT